MSASPPVNARPNAAAGASGAPVSRPIVGILFLLLGVTIFPLQDVIIKSFSSDYAVHQIVFLRGLFALPVVFLIVHFDGGLSSLKLGSFWMQFFRAATGFTSYIVYYLALAAIGMAETAAITFSTPIFVTIMATLFLGERIGWSRWVAVALGLAGVLVVIRPGADVFEPAALLALGAAMAYAVSIIITRKLGSATNGGTMTLFTLVFFIAAGGGLGLMFHGAEGAGAHPSMAFLYREWRWPLEQHLPYFAALGLISGVGFFALSQAYRLAEASVVTPFEYTYLFWAVLWGWVFFGALPTAMTWVGLFLIIGAGLGILFREVKLGRRIVRRKGLGVARQR